MGSNNSEIKKGTKIGLSKKDYVFMYYHCDIFSQIKLFIGNFIQTLLSFVTHLLPYISLSHSLAL